jgi:hypothetical protein
MLLRSSVGGDFCKAFCDESAAAKSSARGPKLHLPHSDYGICSALKCMAACPVRRNGTNRQLFRPTALLAQSSPSHAMTLLVSIYK